MKSNPEKHIARLVGVLFLAAMAAAIAGNVLVLPVLSDADYLQAVFENSARLRLAAILMLVNSICVAGIGVLMYQLLRQRKSIIALSYIAARIIESVVLIFGIASILSLPGLAEEYVADGTADKSYILTLGKSAIGNNWHAYNLAMIVLGLGSLLFCYVLLQLSLVPRFLSVLGLVGYAVLATASLLAILDVDLGLVVTIPVFIFEVVLGIWLIFKGFDFAEPRVATSPPGQSDHHLGNGR